MIKGTLPLNWRYPRNALRNLAFNVKMAARPLHPDHRGRAYPPRGTRVEIRPNGLFGSKEVCYGTVTDVRWGACGGLKYKGIYVGVKQDGDPDCYKFSRPVEEFEFEVDEFRHEAGRSPSWILQLT